MGNLLGLGSQELQRTAEEATTPEDIDEDLSSLSTEELLIRYRKTIGIA